jgi:hypothetical protein
MLTATTAPAGILWSLVLPPRTLAVEPVIAHGIRRYRARVALLTRGGGRPC